MVNLNVGRACRLGAVSASDQVCDHHEDGGVVVVMMMVVLVKMVMVMLQTGDQSPPLCALILISLERLKSPAGLCSYPLHWNRHHHRRLHVNLYENLCVNLCVNIHVNLHDNIHINIRVNLHANIHINLHDVDIHINYRFQKIFISPPSSS